MPATCGLTAGILVRNIAVGRGQAPERFARCTGNPVTRKLDLACRAEGEAIADGSTALVLAPLLIDTQAYLHLLAAPQVASVTIPSKGCVP